MIGQVFAGWQFGHLQGAVERTRIPYTTRQFVLFFANSWYMRRGHWSWPPTDGRVPLGLSLPHGQFRREKDSYSVSTHRCRECTNYDPVPKGLESPHSLATSKALNYVELEKFGAGVLSKIRLQSPHTLPRMRSESAVQGNGLGPAGFSRYPRMACSNCAVQPRLVSFAIYSAVPVDKTGMPA
jgi:hypothetical protein